jgi:hypothetical protein
MFTRSPVLVCLCVVATFLFVWEPSWLLLGRALRWLDWLGSRVLLRLLPSPPSFPGPRPVLRPPALPGVCAACDRRVFCVSRRRPFACDIHDIAIGVPSPLPPLRDEDIPF